MIYAFTLTPREANPKPIMCGVRISLATSAEWEIAICKVKTEMEKCFALKRKVDKISENKTKTAKAYSIKDCPWIDRANKFNCEL